MDPASLSWPNLSDKTVKARGFVCGYCGYSVGSDRGVQAQGLPPAAQGTRDAFIRICGNCTRPSYFEGPDRQFPGPKPASEIGHMPSDVSELYDEARSALAGSAPTAAVLTARKILMHVGVEQGAAANKKFVEYVKHLADQGIIPPNAHGWVNYIREHSNEANHEIVVRSVEEATQILGLTEQLLRIVYELPNLIPAQVTQPSAESTQATEPDTSAPDQHPSDDP